MKKARYDGPSGTGVDLNVTLADGQQRVVHVDQGHQLPSEIGGVNVPAKFVNALLEQDAWSEVKVNTDKKNDDKADSQAKKEG